jgi:hypothetical protein
MRKLPVFLALKHMLQSITSHWRVAARFALPWLILMALLNSWDLLNMPEAKTTPANFELRGTTYILMAVGLLASSSIAVSWHRFILLDEQPNTIGPFRIDRIVWIYLARNILISLIGILPLLISAVVFDALPNILLPVWLALALLFVTFMARLSTSLPATAIDRKDFGLKEALAVTKGNNLPILGLLLLNGLLMLGALLLFVIILSVAKATAPSIVLPATIVLEIPFQLIIILLNTSLQTTLYGYFAENRAF